MAYVPYADEEQNKPANTGAAPLPTTGGGGGASPTTGGSATPAPQSASQGFANINQYLGANQGQGQQAAGTVASNLNNQYTGLQGDINNAANQASEAITGATTAYNPDVISAAFNNPSQFIADPNNLAAWQKQYNAAYTGPTAFENTAGYGTAANAANKAAQTYQLGQSGGGYTQLLNQIEKNPTAGKTALDKALIQADPNAQQTIQSSLNPFKGIQDYMAGKSADINKQASEAAKTTGEAASKSKEALTSAEQNLSNDVTQRYQTGLANQNAYNQKVGDLQKAYTPYESLLNSYETSTGQNYGDPFAMYKQVQPAQMEVTPESQATKSQFANEAALEKLGGQPLNILGNEAQPDYSKFRDEEAYSAAQQNANKPGQEGQDARLYLLQHQGDLTQGQYGNVPTFNTTDLNPNMPSSAFGGWYQKALEDAARQTGWTPEAQNRYGNAPMSAEQWLTGQPSRGSEGTGHRNTKFDNLLNELHKLNQVSDLFKEI